MKKIAVFGGSGFIGKNLIKELESRSLCPHVFDIKMDESQRIESFTNVKDISSDKLLDELSSYDVIIDLVYATTPQTSFEDPVADIRQNLPSAVDLLNIAKQLPDLKNYIYISSGGTVYGDTSFYQIKESHSTNPISPYGITKLAIEKYAQMFNVINELPISIVRPSNAYGIGQKSNRGQGFIIAAIDAVIKDRPITIFGEQGTIRDYIYISDLCTAIADISSLNGNGTIYNVGTGIGMSNLDIMKLIEPLAKWSDREIKIDFLPKRKFDVEHNVLNFDRIANMTGWKPLISIKEGIELTWNYELNK